MNYNVGLFVGHGTSEVDGTFDSGAVSGQAREYDLANSIVNKTISLLNGTGLSIHKDEQNYKDNDTKGNSYSSKFVLSVHINAGGGLGSEIFVPLNEKIFDTESEILNEMKKLGFNNRGIKSRDYDTEKVIIRQNGVKLSGKDYYKEIRDAWSNGISLSIFEVGFIDSGDVRKIQNNINEIAKIIAQAICNLCDVKLPSEPSPPVTQTTPNSVPSNGLFRVKADGIQIGAFKDIKNILSAIEGAIAKGVIEIKVEKV